MTTAIFIFAITLVIFALFCLIEALSFEDEPEPDYDPLVDKRGNKIYDK